MNQIRYLWTAGIEYTPFMSQHTREEMLAGWDKAIERSMGWVENDEHTAFPNVVRKLTMSHGAKRRSAVKWRWVCA